MGSLVRKSTDARCLPLKSLQGGYDKRGLCSFLKGVPLFSDFSDAAIQAVLQKTLIKRYAKDHLLFVTGDAARFFYIIISGCLKLFRETQDGHEFVHGLLSEGHSFGRCGFSKTPRMPCSVQALTDLWVLAIPLDFVRHMMQNPHDFAHFLPRFLDSQSHDLDTHYLEEEHLAHMTSLQRLACFLLRHTGHSSIFEEHGTPNMLHIPFPYEKALIAKRLGMKPETLSRALPALDTLGITIKDTEMTIRDVTKVRNAVCRHCSATRKECRFAW